MNDEYLIKMEDIVKEFLGVKALDNVNFNLKKGEIHVLLGENGAGKSTLMKVLTGSYRKTSGKIFFEDKEVEFLNTKQSLDAGISIIYQELNIIPSLTVAENIFLGKEPMKHGLINWERMYIDSKKILEYLKANINPKDKAKSLSIGQQQMIEIAKALSCDAEIIIMDEPTAALIDKEVDELFRIIKELKLRGVSIIYISHRLKEIQQLGDRATILRDGKYIGTLNIDENLDMNKIIKMIVGRELNEQFPKKYTSIKEEVLTVKNITTKDKLKKCSFSLKKGEILGIAGLMGAGRTELARAIIGADPIVSGEIYMEGKLIKINSPEDAVKNDIGFLPEDRKTQGLILNLNVKDNLTITNLKKLIKGKIFLNPTIEKEESLRLVNSLNIKISHIYQKVKFLSGGNQQKVVLAKWLFTESKVFIFDEPTRGIDVGAKVEFYTIIAQLAKNGAGIIIISSYLPEILGISNRILVMRKGEIVAEMDCNEATQEKILSYAAIGI